MKALNLYRGISSKEFELISETKAKKHKLAWEALLELRAKGNFSYPVTFEKLISTLKVNTRFEHQYFTDRKEIAAQYAKDVNGLLIEVRVPINDLIKHFEIEFQNYGQRKKQFELVYRIKSSVLHKMRDLWRLKVRSLK